MSYLSSTEDKFVAAVNQRYDAITGSAMHHSAADKEDKDQLCKILQQVADTFIANKKTQRHLLGDFHLNRKYEHRKLKERFGGTLELCEKVLCILFNGLFAAAKTSYAFLFDTMINTSENQIK